MAGMIEPGESLEAVARREVQEKAGLNVVRCKPIISYLASSGGISKRLAVMVGEVDARAAQGIYGLDEENEDIRVHVFSRERSYA